LDNSTVIHNFKLWTAKEQAVDIDIANRKRGYDLKKNVFRNMYT